VEVAFRQILGEAGGIDILVNNVWGGYEGMVENSEFTWPKPFLATAALALGRDVQRGRACALPRKSACRADCSGVQPVLPNPTTLAIPATAGLVH
jgi:hypothetical protein